MQILAQVSKVSMMHNKLKHGLLNNFKYHLSMLLLLAGVIGEYLPMDKIKTGTEHIKDTKYTTAGAFNEAILTTDTCTKHIAVSLKSMVKPLQLVVAPKVQV